jgi:hypothetical protein
MKYYRIDDEGEMDYATPLEFHPITIFFRLNYGSGHEVELTWNNRDFYDDWTPCSPLMEALL